MTREEAIAVLRREIEPSVYEDEKSIAEAVDMAIEALSAEVQAKCIAEIKVDAEDIYTRITGLVADKVSVVRKPIKEYENMMTREEARQGLQGYSLFIADGTDLKEALNMAIEALQEVQKHEETFEWCTDCKEYDKDNYCCHRWSKMIRNTVEELKEYSGLVRCKDCKWYECGGLPCPIDLCESLGDDGFCSRGERKEK